MRTTVDIADGVYTGLKLQAAKQQTSVKALLSRGAALVLSELERMEREEAIERKPWPVIGKKGGKTVGPFSNDFAFFGHLDGESE